jgi:hypothetical protein
MPKKKSPEEDPKEQHDRFKEMARETGAEKNAEAFDRTFKKIVPPAKGAKK